MNTLTVAISTHNRAEILKAGLLMRSLIYQTMPPDELVVCCHNCTDDTIPYLQMMKRHTAFPVRILDCTEPQPHGLADSVLADNVLIREAKGDIFLHLDDDGWVDTYLVETVHSLYRNYAPVELFYGTAKFYRKETMKPYGNKFVDNRLAHCQRERLRVCKIEATHLWGFMWAATTDTLRAMGGHDMAFAGKRACDTRLGQRFEDQKMPAMLCATDAMTFHHIGLTRTQASVDKADWVTIAAEHTLPKPGLSPFVCNGGESFWGDKFPIKYVEVQ